MKLLRLCLRLVLLLLAGCAPSSPAPSIHSDIAFGQPLQLNLQGMVPEQAKAAASAALADLHFVEEVSHPWHPGPLGRTNQLLAMGGDFSANPSLLPLIRRATELAGASQGYYNPTLGKLRALWGLQQDKPGIITTPASEALETLLSQGPQMQDIHIDGIRMRGNNSALRIDFGPFAQGYALDTAISRLRESGAPRARLHNGGFTLLLGATQESVRLPLTQESVRLPLRKDKELVVRLVGNEALARLDSRERHYLDPQNGRPLEAPVIAAVIADSAADAAAAAQALLLAPPAKEETLLRQMGIKYALVQRENGGLGVTTAMADRLEGTSTRPQRLMVNRQ